MKFSTFSTFVFGAAAASTVAYAATVPYATNPVAVDVEIIQYALTLEHLEATFYAQALAQFGPDAFAAAGYPPQVWQRMSEVAYDEKTHVEFLSSALTAAGVTPTAACEYNFPYADVNSFLGLSRLIEGVGVSAYLYKAQFINNKEYLEAAGSILTVEARHQALVSSFLKEDGTPSPFDTPLTGSEVYSLAVPFFKSCPATNPGLPFKAFPNLSITSISDSSPIVKFGLPEGVTGDVWFHLYNGLNDYAIKSSDGSVSLPDALSGTVYVVVSSSEARPNDDTTIAGPAIINLNFPDYTSVGGKKARRAIKFSA